MHVKKLKITEMGGNYETLVDAVIRADQTNFKRQFCECQIIVYFLELHKYRN